jgi:hypothetical protein
MMVLNDSQLVDQCLGNSKFVPEKINEVLRDDALPATPASLHMDVVYSTSIFAW